MQPAQIHKTVGAGVEALATAALTPVNGKVAGSRSRPAVDCTL